MVVGDNESAATKNAGKSLANSIAMQMRWCDAGGITQYPMEYIPGFNRSHWMPPSGECLHRITPAAAMVDDFGRKH